MLKKGIQFGYDNYIRPILSRRTVFYNEIPVKASHLGDSLIPWHNKDIPGYEAELIRGIRKRVQKNDSVVIVGGGWGISTVVAANQVGTAGEVITYEGAEKAVNRVLETVRLNNIQDRISVHHSIVAENISLQGSAGGAAIVHPSELPDCDVLVLDCEGAELTILEEIEIQPRVLIVETHGMYGASKDDVAELLEDIEYDIQECNIAEPRLKQKCIKNGIYVLMSTRKSKA